MEQWSEEQKAGRPGVVFGSRMGQLADVANTSLAALAPRDEKLSCGKEPCEWAELCPHHKHEYTQQAEKPEAKP